MKMQSVNSTHLDKIGYDEGKQTLRIRFRDASEYDYFLVPRRIYLLGLRVNSAGTWFRNNIKGKYRYQKVES